MTEAKSTFSAKDPSAEWSAFQATRWLYSRAWAAAKLRLMYSLVPAERDTSHGKPSEMFAESGDEPQDSTSTRIS